MASPRPLKPFFKVRILVRQLEQVILRDPERSRGNFFMAYFVYILRTSADTLYIGQTNNLEKRLKEHQSKSVKSAKYVRYFDSVSLVHSEKYAARKEALISGKILL